MYQVFVTMDALATLDQINAEWLANPSKFEWLGKMRIREVEELFILDQSIEQDLENHFSGIDQINAEMNIFGADHINAEFEQQRS